MAVQCKSLDDGDQIVDIKIPSTEINAGSKSRKIAVRPALFLFGFSLVLLLVAIVIWMIIVLIKYEIPNHGTNLTVAESTANATDLITETFTVESTTFTDPQLMSPKRLHIISRQEWIAQPPAEPLKPLHLPVEYVVISHTATENCTNQASCTFHVRYIQAFHIESRFWYDIGYNFLIGGDGFVYEGRGWKSEGSHTYGYNSKSIGIAFIGTFNQILPPQRQIDAAKLLIEKGVELGYISPDYKVLGSRQVQNTQSPGLKLYANVKTWPHWSEKL